MWNNFFLLFFLLGFFSCTKKQKKEDINFNYEMSSLYDSATSLYKNEMFDSMNEVGRLIIQIDSLDINGYLIQATYWKDKEEYDSAIFYFNKASIIEPLFEIQLDLADLYYKTSQDSMELFAINEAINLETYQSKKITKDMFERGYLPTDDTLIVNVSRQNLGLKRRKKWYWEHQLYDSAFKDMDSIIDYQPYGDNYFEKGMMYYTLKEYSSALVEFDNALNGQKYYLSDTASLYIHQASCFGKMGLNKKAFDLYEQILEEFGESAELYYLRGITYFDMDKKNLACQDWEKAISLGMEIKEFSIYCK
jgi:tetratricopeptide (TPR) repeat protein